MKRRTFVSFSILSGAAFTLFPLNSLSAGTRKIETVRIHSNEPHIRHGHLYDDEYSFTSSCPWLKNVKQDIFLRSEYSQSQDDLKHLTIETDGEVIGIGINNEQVLLNINGSSFSSFENEISLNNGRKLKYYRAKENGSILLHASNFVLPLGGILNIEGRKMRSNEAIYVLNEPVELEYNRNSQFLIINS